MNLRPFTLAAVVPSLLLASCGEDGGSEPETETSGEKRSIFRPEFQVEPIESLEPQGSLQTLVQFPEGAELTEEARAELATILASPQVEQGGPIILRGHSDSGGSDEGNMRASRARAEAVRDWLVDSGVDGVLLDYTRYFGPETGYSDIIVREFKAKTGAAAAAP